MKKLLLLEITVVTLIMAMIINYSCQEDNEGPDPCEGITCLNGGTCIDGLCDCPDGYSGDSCSSQVTPSKILISEIRIVSWPAYTHFSSEPWDPDSGPDIYLRFEQEELPSLLYYSTIEDATLYQSYSYIPSPSIELSNVFTKCQIVLREQDSGTYWEIMDVVDIYFYSDTNGFPNLISRQGSYGTYFSLTVSYEW